MNFYCTMAGSCEDNRGYLQNSESGRDSLLIKIMADSVFIIHSNFQTASPILVDMHDKPDSVSSDSRNCTSLHESMSTFHV